MQQACPHCGGRGKTIAKPCGDCHGQGRVEREKTLQVKIPAGVDNGDRIRLAGEGEAGPAGAPPGDLYVEVRVREHEIFQRDGDDLHCEVPIRISQAALGRHRPRADAGWRGGTAHPGRNPDRQAVPPARQGREVGAQPRTGDLYCRVVVETPVNLTTEQRELLEKFEATFVGDGARGIRRARRPSSTA